MDTTAMPTDTKKEAAPEPESAGPDGFGLSLEDVRGLLAKKHDTIVPKDDPLLLVVTILNAFLGEVNTLQDKHKAAMVKLLTERTDAYVAGVKEATDGLSATLSSSTAEGLRKINEENALRLQSFRINMWWATAVMAVSALLNVSVFVLR